MIPLIPAALAVAATLHLRRVNARLRREADSAAVATMPTGVHIVEDDTEREVVHG